MKITIPKNLKGKDLFDYLIANKSDIVTQKKMPRWGDNCEAPVDYFGKRKTATTKADGSTDVVDSEPEADTVNVKFYGNTCLYFDSQSDVLLPDSSKRTLTQNKDLIQHLHDHIQKTDAIIGDMQDITIPYVNWADLGVNFPGQTQVILCDSIVRLAYNEKLYNLYKNKRIKQHSIGLQYVQISLAINDPEYKEEYALYIKWIDLIANKDVVNAAGYFWAVAEIKLLEVSAVLYGSNPITGMDDNGNPSGKSIATYDDSDNADDLMYCDKMMRKHNKTIATANEYTGDDAEIKMMASNAVYNATNSITHIKQIKDRMQGKSIENDPSNDIHNRPFDIAKAIKETKFINLN